MYLFFPYESEFVIQSTILWWFLPPLIDDKMTYILVMQFSDGDVHTGLEFTLKKRKTCLDESKLKYCDV